MHTMQEYDTFNSPIFKLLSGMLIALFLVELKELIVQNQSKAEEERQNTHSQWMVSK